MFSNRQLAKLPIYDNKASNGVFAPFDRNLFPIIFRHLARDEDGLKSVLSFFLTNKYFYSLFSNDKFMFDLINDIDLGHRILFAEPVRFRFSEINHVLMAALLRGSDPLSERQRLEFNSKSFDRKIQEEKDKKRAELKSKLDELSQKLAELSQKQDELDQKQAELKQKEQETTQLPHETIVKPKLLEHGITGVASLSAGIESLKVVKHRKEHDISRRNEMRESDILQWKLYTLVISLVAVALLRDLLLENLPLLALPLTVLSTISCGMAVGKYRNTKRNQANAIDQDHIRQISEAIQSAERTISALHYSEAYIELKAEVGKLRLEISKLISEKDKIKLVTEQLQSNLVSLDNRRYDPRLGTNGFTRRWLSIDFFGRNAPRVTPDIIRRLNQVIEVPQQYDGNEWDQWNVENQHALAIVDNVPVGAGAPAGAAVALAVGAVVLAGIFAWAAAPNNANNRLRNQDFNGQDGSDDELDLPGMRRRDW
jgi:hypothetical protein